MLNKPTSEVMRLLKVILKEHKSVTKFTRMFVVNLVAPKAAAKCELFSTNQPQEFSRPRLQILEKTINLLLTNALDYCRKSKLSN
jgi:hypothetical protein